MVLLIHHLLKQYLTYSNNFIWLLTGFDFSPVDVKDMDKSILTYHRLTEILKFAYAKRSALGDEEFVNTTDVSNLFFFDK